jgi:uncharacterized membrane protein YgcG
MVYLLRCSRLLYALTFLALLLAIDGCGGPKLKSTWTSEGIAVDGQDGEWSDMQFYFSDERVTVGLANDAQHLYLYLNTADRGVQIQLLRRGFTVLFDAKGGNKASFGVRFPLELERRSAWEIMDRQPLVERRDDAEGGLDSRGGFADPGSRRSAQREVSPKIVEAIFAAVRSGKKMELIGKTPYDKRRLPVDSVPGVEVALNYIDGRLIYELKVPLARVQGENYWVGIGVDKKTIGIGFETPAIDANSMRQGRRGRGMGGGGMGGSGMGGGGRRGGGMGGGRRVGMMPTPLKLWTKVELAER